MEPPFVWTRRPGCAPAAVYPPGLAVPRPLEAEATPAGTVAWLPLAHVEAGRRALAALPPPALRLFPGRYEDVPAVVQAWLGLYRDAPRGLEEAVLQVTDDPAHLRDYVAAEVALWKVIYAKHPHREDPGILPRALDEAQWLCDLVLEDKGYAEASEFLTMSAFEAIARALLFTVRKAELQNLAHALEGQDTVRGW